MSKIKIAKYDSITPTVCNGYEFDVVFFDEIPDSEGARHVKGVLKGTSNGKKITLVTFAETPDLKLPKIKIKTLKKKKELSGGDWGVVDESTKFTKKQSEYLKTEKGKKFIKKEFNKIIKAAEADMRKSRRIWEK